MSALSFCFMSLLSIHTLNGHFEGIQLRYSVTHECFFSHLAKGDIKGVIGLNKNKGRQKGKFKRKNT